MKKNMENNKRANESQGTVDPYESIPHSRGSAGDRREMNEGTEMQ